MSAEERALPATGESNNKWHPLQALFRATGIDRKIDIRIGHNGAVQSGNDRPYLTITRPLRLLSRLLMRGDLGFAEGYMAGEWDTNDLTTLFMAIGANESGSHIRQGIMSERIRERLRHALRNNSRNGSRRNIAYHYDLSNDFYAQWLDPTMTYSSAIFEEPGASLEDAQHLKYQRLLDALNAQPGDHILEIGCGWGGFAEEAARRGCRVTGVTLSREQLAYARERMRKAGAGELVTLEFRDYRELTITSYRSRCLKLSVNDTGRSTSTNSGSACVRAAQPRFRSSPSTSMPSSTTDEGQISSSAIFSPAACFQPQNGSTSWQRMPASGSRRSVFMVGTMHAHCGRGITPSMPA
jgi:hypothetical protein